MTTLTSTKNNFILKIMFAVLGVIGAIALPQIFHAVGVFVGVGSKLGEVFLPMHLPVMIAGLLGGPFVGLAAGALSPVVSFAIFGMPNTVMLPFITLEIAGYGFFMGLTVKTKLPTLAKVLIAQFGGRAMRSIAVVVSFYAFGNVAPNLQSIWGSILTGVPGIIIQILLFVLGARVIAMRHAK